MLPLMKPVIKTIWDFNFDFSGIYKTTNFYDLSFLSENFLINSRILKKLSNFLLDHKKREEYRKQEHRSR
jgi:hypothetical protein